MYLTHICRIFGFTGNCLHLTSPSKNPLALRKSLPRIVSQRFPFFGMNVVLKSVAQYISRSFCLHRCSQWENCANRLSGMMQILLNAFLNPTISTISLIFFTLSQNSRKRNSFLSDWHESCQRFCESDSAAA